jgi:hypothetical protein
MIAEKFTRDQLADLFDYLDALRESGATNMFGAGEYLARDHDLDARDARTVLVAWMKSFDRDTPPEVRAERVCD